jgi:AcrR family transcriptional regulator
MLSTVTDVSASIAPWGEVSLDSPDGVRAKVLDAAMVRFTQQGIARTTMSQLAADVGISREWLYRHFDNRDSVVRALLGREAQRFLLELGERVDPALAVTDAVIEGFVLSVERLRAHELLQRVLLTEPETAAPFVTTGSGVLLEAATTYAAGYLRARARLTPADARDVAETLLRLVLSIVVNNDAVIDFDDARQRRAYAQRIVPRLLGT